MNDERYTVTPQDVAALLAVTAVTVRRMCALGELPCVCLCVGLRTRWRIREDWLEWMQRRVNDVTAERTAAEKMRRVAKAQQRQRVARVAS